MQWLIHKLETSNKPHKFDFLLNKFGIVYVISFLVYIKCRFNVFLNFVFIFNFLTFYAIKLALQKMQLFDICDFLWQYNFVGENYGSKRF